MQSKGVVVREGAFANYYDFSTDKERWRAERAGRITGTDIAKILGVDGRCSPQKLFRYKLADIDPVEEEATKNPYLRQLLQFGTDHEADAIEDYFEFVRQEFCYDPRWFCETMTPFDARSSAIECFSWERPSLIYVREELHGYAGTPDMILSYEDMKEDGTMTGNSMPLAIVEFKCHSYPSIESATPIENPYDIPDKHLVQIQSYLGLVNRWAHFREGDPYSGVYPSAAQLVSWTKYSGYTVFGPIEPHPVLIELIANRASAFSEALETARMQPAKAAALEKSIKVKKKEREATKALLDEIRSQMGEPAFCPSPIMLASSW